MYTSVIKANKSNARRTALIYLFVSIFCAVFGAVYEIFSHGVYSAFMVFAFVFPLIGGALPFLLLYIADRGREKALRGRSSFRIYPSIPARCFYHCGIIALTIGSILTGVLEIYGTTNRLIIIYWFLGAAMLLAGLSLHLLSLLFNRSYRRTY